MREASMPHPERKSQSTTCLSMLWCGRTRGEEKLSFGNTAPYSFTTSRMRWSSSGNANVLLSSSSSSSPSSSDSSLSTGLEIHQSHVLTDVSRRGRLTNTSSEPSGRKTPSESRYSLNSAVNGRMTVDLILWGAKRGYQAENWKARMAGGVSGGKSVGEVVGTGIAWFERSDCPNSHVICTFDPLDMG